MIAAPFTGGILFNFGGYNFLFYFFGFIFLITALRINSMFDEGVDAQTGREQGHT